MSRDAPFQPMMVSEQHPLPMKLHPYIDHIVTEDGAPVDNVGRKAFVNRQGEVYR